MPSVIVRCTYCGSHGHEEALCPVAYHDACDALFDRRWGQEQKRRLARAYLAVREKLEALNG